MLNFKPLKNEFMKNIHLLKNTITIVFMFFIHNFLFAQENDSKITFLQDSFDFGMLNELDGEVKHTFKFVNTGQDSLLLTAVDASCGCTTPFWDKKAILPGDSGKIVVAFNPMNRPGSFQKSITVNSNANPGIHLLQISGNVKPKRLTTEDLFPVEIGGIRLESKFVNFGTITAHKTVNKIIQAYNQTEDTIRFSERIVSGDYITVKYEPNFVAPKQETSIIITYDPVKRNDLGFMNDAIALFTDENEVSHKSLSIYATILEYFPPMTEEELAKAPKIQFEKDMFDFGHVNKGDNLTYTFNFKNIGKEKLLIRKTKSNCPCTEVDLNQMDFKKEAEGEIKITLDTKGITGSQIKRVTIFSNDPTLPAKDLVVKAYIRD